MSRVWDLNNCDSCNACSGTEELWEDLPAGWWAIDKDAAYTKVYPGDEVLCFRCFPSSKAYKRVIVDDSSLCSCGQKLFIAYEDDRFTNFISVCPSLSCEKARRAADAIK